MLSNQSDIIGHALKMVVAMRREFGRNIDVMAIANDPVYARTVIDLAAGSTNARLREQAQYLESMISGPRDSPDPVEAQAHAPEAPPTDQAGSAEVSEASPTDQAGSKDAGEALTTAKRAKYLHGLR